MIAYHSCESQSNGSGCRGKRRRATTVPCQQNARSNSRKGSFPRLEWRTVSYHPLSLQPEQDICSLRSLLRHRESPVERACGHVQHMQKALDQMNLHITGMAGLAIIDAILEGPSVVA